MADADNTPAAGEGKEMTLAEITATIKAIGPQIAALTSAMAALGAPAAAATPAATVVEDKAPATAPAGVTAEAMDAAIKAELAKPDVLNRVMKSLTQRDKLADRLSTHVGVFDHSEMTHGDVVVYGLDKLGIKDKAPAGAESVYLDAYLDAKPAATARRGAPAAVAMDAADAGDTPEFLKAHV